jgi:hypothetical protein
MKNILIQQVLRQAVCLVCVPLLAGGLLVAQQPGVPPQAPAQAPAQMLTPQQLETMVAPVALYPDRLLGQILAASTYPLEIAEAAQWLPQNSSLQGPQLVDAARQQNWDPSVQALVVFPDVLNRLSSDIRWTTALGNAFLAQQADVMSAVQRMRARAQTSGKLRSNGQQTVTRETEGDQSAIDIEPANPEVVYVPYYNPQYIWGPPAYGYYPGWDYLDIGYGFGYGFGPGIYIGGFFGGLGWGGWGWWPNWFRGGIFLNGGFFGRYGFGGRGLSAAASGRTMPHTGWVWPIRMARSVVAMAQLRRPASDLPHTPRRGPVRRPGQVPRRVPLRRPAVGTVSAARLGHPAPRKRIGGAAVVTAPVRHTAAAARRLAPAIAPARHMAEDLMPAPLIIAADRAIRAAASTAAAEAAATVAAAAPTVVVAAATAAAVTARNSP